MMGDGEGDLLRVTKRKRCGQGWVREKCGKELRRFVYVRDTLLVGPRLRLGGKGHLRERGLEGPNDKKTWRGWCN